MPDIMSELLKINCGGHRDLCCFATTGRGDLRMLSDLVASFTDDQVLEIIDAICCAKVCGIAPGGVAVIGVPANAGAPPPLADRRADAAGPDGQPAPQPPLVGPAPGRPDPIPPFVNPRDIVR